MKKYEIYELINCFITSGEIRLDEQMSKHTTFKIGGNADLFILPKTDKEIRDVYITCKQNKIPLTIIGNGSNLLVRDKGIRGVVMKVFSNYADINVANNIITAKSGALLSKIANLALENELTGFEFASGIPGTLGGAVLMNAGAYDGEIKDVVFETSYLDENGIIKTITGDEHQFGYRKSIFQEKNNIILESKIRLNKGIYDNIKSKMSDLNNKRKEKQPINYPSAGSTFKRPEGHYAGKLIEDCNLKGFCIGGAQVSELHAGFIINKQNATCKDVINLIKYVQSEVKEKFGVKIETEVKIIGEE